MTLVDQLRFIRDYGYYLQRRRQEMLDELATLEPESFEHAELQAQIRDTEQELEEERENYWMKLAVLRRESIPPSPASLIPLSDHEREQASMTSNQPARRAD